MADNGNSQDNRLLRSLFIGWTKSPTGKWVKDRKKPPKLEGEKDWHQLRLKHYLIRASILGDEYECAIHNQDLNHIYHKFSNLRKRMNQYRQKHWYWKEIQLTTEGGK